MKVILMTHATVKVIKQGTYVVFTDKLIKFIICCLVSLDINNFYMS